MYRALRSMKLEGCNKILLTGITAFVKKPGGKGKIIAARKLHETER